MDTDPDRAVADADAVAHGLEQAPPETRTLVAVFASPVADFLIRYGRDLGYHTALVEPERGRVTNDEDAGTTVLPSLPEALDGDTDVIVTDHHRPELGAAPAGRAGAGRAVGRHHGQPATPWPARRGAAGPRRRRRTTSRGSTARSG